MTAIDARTQASAGMEARGGEGAPLAGFGTFPTLAQKPEVEVQASRLIDAEHAIRLRAVPYRIESGRLLTAMLDPADFAAADELSILAGLPVERHGLAPELFRGLLREVYGTTAAELASRLGGETSADDGLIANLEAVDADELHRMAEQPTLINLVNLIILEAVRGRASDVHVEPFEKKVSVKYRIDGVLVEQSSPPKHLQPAITSRVKIMAGMNIAERYVPQDGHITLRFEGRKVDIRVSTVPTIWGESVVMRILDKESVKLDLVQLGMNEKQREAIQKLIDLPHGMLLVTGPTGSGKTTTLYAALTKLYDPSLKIITIEDPVEYELPGVNQMPVNPKRGLTFATGLRSILRQDPDVIMVGEIRDRETADIAVRSALTGHLLFSTLHTNDAVSAIGRLVDMEVEPFLLASVLEGIIAQRLGRRICEFCREEAPLSDAVKHRLQPAERAMFVNDRCSRGRGCEKCEGSGTRGRIGYYEMIIVNPPLRSAISENMTAQELIKIMGPEHVTMRRDGIMKAAMGQTTVDEVLRATQDSEESFGKK